MNKKNKIRLFPLILASILMIMNNCKKDENSGSPSLTTSTVSTVTLNSAVCGGDITSEGGSAITARGVCWSTNNTPTISDNKTTDGIGNGVFTSNITGLKSNTTYYVRAYATNNEGTGYGSAISLTTQIPGAATVTDIDGNIYHTVEIGTQVWMVENLKVTKYRDGTAIPNVPNEDDWLFLGSGAYCNLNNNLSNGATYGRLYNYYAVRNTHNICPVGWHVPSDEEWSTLTTYLGGEAVAGGKLKEIGLAHWADPNTGATNQSGFTAVPGGKRSDFGTFSSCTGCFGYFWTSTGDNNSENAWSRIISYDSETVTKLNLDYCSGFSIRCILD